MGPASESPNLLISNPKKRALCSKVYVCVVAQLSPCVFSQNKAVFELAHEVEVYVYGEMCSLQVYVYGEALFTPLVHLRAK